jgi:hypothetical protein
MVSRSTAPVAGTGLTNATVTVPPASAVFPNVEYALGVTSQYQNRVRTSCWIYHSSAELTAAAGSRSFSLPDYGISVVAPAAGSTNTGVSPTFSWTASGNPEFVELILSKPAPAAGSYPWQVWIARVYGGSTSVNLPAVLGGLAADTAYNYILYGRTDFTDSNGTDRCMERDGVVNTRFSTGATPPP